MSEPRDVFISVRLTREERTRISQACKARGVTAAGAARAELLGMIVGHPTRLELERELDMAIADRIGFDA